MMRMLLLTKPHTWRTTWTGDVTDFTASKPGGMQSYSTLAEYSFRDKTLRAFVPSAISPVRPSITFDAYHARQSSKNKPSFPCSWPEQKQAMSRSVISSVTIAVTGAWNQGISCSTQSPHCSKASGLSGTSRAETFTGGVSRSTTQRSPRCRESNYRCLSCSLDNFRTRLLWSPFLWHCVVKLERAVRVKSRRRSTGGEGQCALSLFMEASSSPSVLPPHTTHLSQLVIHWRRLFSVLQAPAR